MFGEVLGSRLGLKHLAENAWECVFAISDVSKRILKCFLDLYNSFEGVNDLKYWRTNRVEKPFHGSLKTFLLETDAKEI